MWHQTDPTHPGKWNDGPNVTKLADLNRPLKCAAGLIPMPEVEVPLAPVPSNDPSNRPIRRAA
jgi:hypothetical protein